VAGLRVAARTSVFRFKNVNDDIGEIGRRLNVDHVVEGSVRRTGDRIRITAQLVKVADGYHLWSRTYEHRELADVFDIQDEISREIMASVLPHMRPARLPAHGTQDVVAFDHFARGRYAFWRGDGAATLDESIEHYRAAIARDPGYALAYAGLADAYMLRPGPPRENMPLAKAAALRALELDDNLSEGYVALASINWFYDWNWDAAARNYRLSGSVNRAIYSRCICYVWYLFVVGDVDGAVREARRARALDPVALLPLYTLAQLYLVSGRTPELRTTMDELRDAGVPHEALEYLGTWLALREGREADAVAVIEGLRAGRTADAFVASLSSYAAAGFATIYAVAGRRDEARAIAHALRAGNDTDFVPNVHLAAAFAAAGDTTEASRWVMAAYRERANLAYFAITPEASELRDLPVMRMVLDSVGIPDR
jgi:tetratricopeptide (TPR) repeat protein